MNRIRTATATLALAGALLVVGCSTSGPGGTAEEGSTKGADTTTTAPTTTVDTTPEAPAPEPAPQPDPAPQPQPQPAPQPEPEPEPEPEPVPSGPKPVITSFTTPEDIDCHNGDFQMFSASWTTEHATQTMISIDGPGGYRTYGPDGSDSLPFTCSSAHTFLLTATGPGGTATKSITLQPRNVQTPPTEDGEGDL